MEIKELYMESEFILNSDSYCRKCIFSIPELDSINTRIRTTVTYVNSEEASLVDGYAERYVNGKWNHLADIVPKEATLENLKFVQKELLKLSVVILGDIEDINSFDNIDFKKYEMFKWKDLESKKSKEKENVLTLEFNPKSL